MLSVVTLTNRKEFIVPLPISKGIQEIDVASPKRSELQFRALVASSVDHLYILGLDGVCIYSNNQVVRFGMGSGRQLVGKRMQEVHSRDVGALYRENFHTVIDTGKVVTFEYEQELEKGTGYFQNTLYPIRHEGELWAVGGLCRDLSEQKRIEKQLFQAQKMDALGTLVAGAAHEINNPVNLMLYNLPLFERMWRDLLPVLDNAITNKDKKIGGLTFDFIRKNVPRLISDMEMAANRVTQIVNGLKQFSRKSNPAEKNLVQVNIAVENAARLASSTLSKSQTKLKLALKPSLPSLHANLQNLEQIILNLMINAHQAISHDKGWIKISTDWRREEQAVVIQVQDNGRGINPELVDKLFDPFVTDRQAIGGTGLGLSVTYNLVKAHNGEITFESAPGRGTTFTVRLPIDDKRKPIRFMVVDDDKAFRALLIQLFSRNFYCTVEGFANGAEALIRLGSDPPDVLVLDMFMPEIDGLGVCRAIRSELGLEKTKVIIVTGFPDHPNIIAAKRLGFGEIYTKPLNTELFLSGLEKNINGKSS